MDLRRNQKIAQYKHREWKRDEDLYQFTCKHCNKTVYIEDIYNYLNEEYKTKFGIVLREWSISQLPHDRLLEVLNIIAR